MDKSGNDIGTFATSHLRARFLNEAAGMKTTDAA